MLHVMVDPYGYECDQHDDDDRKDYAEEFEDSVIQSGLACGQLQLSKAAQVMHRHTI